MKAELEVERRIFQGRATRNVASRQGRQYVTTVRSAVALEQGHWRQPVAISHLRFSETGRATGWDAIELAGPTGCLDPPSPARKPAQRSLSTNSRRSAGAAPLDTIPMSRPRPSTSPTARSMAALIHAVGFPNTPPPTRVSKTVLRPLW